jgi:hypothetical protein
MNKPSKDISSWKRRTTLPLSIDGVEISKIIQAEREETVVSGTEPVLKLLLAESTPGNSGGT